MKQLKFMVAVASALFTAWALRTKLRAERVADAPAIATYVKLVFKPIAKWAAGRALTGRYRDSDVPNGGRFTRSDVRRILGSAWRNYDNLAPSAHIERLETVGNRQNLLLGVFTHSLYRALLEEGTEEKHATELVSDFMWKAYETWIFVPRSVARLIKRNPQRQVNLMLRMFLHYPFSGPGYISKYRPQADHFALDIYRCPVQEYFQAQGEGAFMLNSWCTLDFALAQVMTAAGAYTRPHTLSAGDEVCDMKWYAKCPAGVSTKTATGR